MIDPGLLTDSTGEGMAGAEDVSAQTQQMLKTTLYNGTKMCRDCMAAVNPYAAMTTPYCNTCKNRRDSNLVRNGMVKYDR